MLVKCRKCFKRGQTGDHLDQKGFLPSWSDSTRLLQSPVPWSCSPLGWACSPHDHMQTRSGLTQMTTRSCIQAPVPLQAPHQHKQSTHEQDQYKQPDPVLTYQQLDLAWCWCLLLGHVYPCTHNLPKIVQKWLLPVVNPHLWSSPQQTLVFGLSSAMLHITFPHWCHFRNICT